MIDIIDGNTAATWAAKLARVQCIPCFPITPQTEIIETIAEWHSNGLFRTEFNQMESEHSVLSAALGSAMTSARTFTATSSQGLLLMHEILPIVSGTRTPLVMVNVSRGLSAPITLWSDHNDILAMRDAGWLIFVVETNQEVLDSIIMAYKIGENKKVLLPALINMDGFIHSYTRTEVDLPSQNVIDKFLPRFKLGARLDVKNPMTLGTPAMEDYTFFRSQLHKAQIASINVIKHVQKEWYKLTGRMYSLVEAYKLNDADIAFVSIGANSTIVRSAVEKLRKQKIKAGLLRIRLYRPFPEQEIKKALQYIKRVVVLDQNISPGSGGILYPELRSALFHCNQKQAISNYVYGLGGKPVSEQQIIQIAKDSLKSKSEQRKWVI